MGKVYFDITDIVHFAGRSNRLTGIQRVQFNIVNLLARQHGGSAIRCVFFERMKQAMYEFDPTVRPHDDEFDAESLLIDLGLARPSGRFPSKVQIKGFLRRHARSKLQRALLKARIYLWALFAPQRLHSEGLAPSGQGRRGGTLALARVTALPSDSHLVHLGSSWFFPEVWQFAAEHRARGGDVVQYVHDLIPVMHPHFMPAKEPPLFINWLNHALDYATRFPCNSQWTAHDLERYAQQQKRHLSIHVTPLAHEFIGFERNATVAAPANLMGIAGKRFVLCVGTIEARKNGLSLLKVWQQLIAELGEKTPLLVFAGRYGRIGGEEFREYVASDAGLTRYVQIIDMPSDQALAWLYRHCLFSAYPSHVEGWGLPVGESAWFGRYCVASKASSVPEVCGDLAGYVDPDDLDSIKGAILKPLLDPSYLQQREQAIAAASLRSWRDVADDLYVYITSSSG
ncbi:MAG: glycosyltransferase [Steroidobacteraceae bacterium]